MISVYILSFLTIVFWTVAKWPIEPLFSDKYTTFLYLGQVSGLVGMTLFSISLILSARIKFLENIFKGLNQEYKRHHQIGGVSFILMMVHPLFLLFSRITISLEYARNLILPGNDFNTDLGIISLLLMMSLLVVTFYTKLPYQIWRLTHKFTGLVFIIAVFHSFLIPSTITQDKPLWWFMFTVSLTGILAYLYRTVFFRFLVKRYKYSITKVKKLTNKVVEITMTPSGENRIYYDPGQFIFVSFKSPKVTDEIHPFSISSANTSDITIISKVEGDYTGNLMEIEIGSEAIVEGAFGRFSYRFYPNPRQIWIAGGIGITPFIGMAEGLKDDPNYKVDLYYCLKDVSEKLGIPVSTVNIKAFYSKTMGHITGKYIGDNSEGFASADYFICGPVVLMKTLREQLVKLGIKNSRIHTEEFTFD